MVFSLKTFKTNRSTFARRLNTRAKQHCFSCLLLGGMFLGNTGNGNIYIPLIVRVSTIYKQTLQPVSHEQEKPRLSRVRDVECGIQIWTDWPQMGQIWDSLRSVSVHFGSASQIVLKLILKSPRCTETDFKNFQMY